MWVYLSNLHPLLPYSVVVMVIIATVIISLRGKLMIKWGKNAIGIGDQSNPSDKPSPPVDPRNAIPHDTTTAVIIPGPPGTVFLEKKRTCADCSHIMINEYEKYEINKQARADKILTYRMNYSEEKLMEIETDLTDKFEKRLEEYGKIHTGFSPEIESMLYYGLLKDSLYHVKKEIRRAFKENGFCELSDYDFANFIKDKSRVVISVLIRQMRNLYPGHGTAVSVETIIMDIESMSNSINEHVKNIFTYAKQVIAENEEEMKRMNLKFKDWVDNFVK